MLISGHLGDIKDKHISMSKDLSGRIIEVCYDTDKLKEEVSKAGSFEDFLKSTTFVNLQSIMVAKTKGLL